MKISFGRKELIDNKIKITSNFRLPVNAVIQINFIVFVIPLCKDGRDNFCRKIVSKPRANLMRCKTAVVNFYPVKRIITRDSKMLIESKR